VVSSTSRPHPEMTWYPFYRRLDGPQGRSGRAENLVPTGIRYRNVQNVVSRYTECATGPTRSGPEGSRKLRFPDCMTTAQDGDKFVSLTHRPPLTAENALGTHFCWRLSRLQGHSAIGRIMSMKNSNDTIWNRTSDLPICSNSTLTTVSQRSPHASYSHIN